MARTTREIYDAMLRDKAQRSELAELNSSSTASIWRLLLWVVASAINVAEQLWEAWKMEVDVELAEQTPHRVDWYAAKAKAFVRGKVLMPGSDRYDLAGMSDSEIDQLRIVKYAAAIEGRDYSVLYVKVAGEDAGGNRAPLSDAEAVQVAAYMNEVKDVGVRIELVNKPADIFRCSVKVLYDPILSPEVMRERVRSVIEAYVENLEFNGEYSNMALIDAVQRVQGVKIAEVEQATVEEAGTGSERGVNVRYTPVAGYMVAEDIVVDLEAYSVYESL